MEPRAITPAHFDAESIVGCDEKAGFVYFIASPSDPLRRYVILFFEMSLGGLGDRGSGLEL